MRSERPDYFPLEAGSVFEFEVERDGGVGRQILEVVSVEAAGGTVQALFRRTDGPAEDRQTVEYGVTRDPSWVRVEGELELPCSPAPGMSWNAAPLSMKVSEVGAEVRVPAGTFQGCVRVSYLVAGGDAGSGERFYAPGVGLVCEECSEEASPFTSRLVRYSLPGGRP
ncbi:MAG: hypothetical protein HY924_00400 [Elusimicrobia bacterium]|nr:hypothetical protein [Elusimicrobiota bacterium]